MGASVRYRSTYYNTTGPETQCTIEILDSEWGEFVTNFSSTRPIESYEGLTQDLKPGIYGNTFKFGMMIRSSPKVITGTTMGVTDDFIEDIFTAAEGRFLVRYYQDGVLHFVGPIIYDQCSYEDLSEPYELSITAVDGLNRWKTVDYVSLVGQLAYYTKTERTHIYDTIPLIYDGPITGVSILTLEHVVNAEGVGTAASDVQKKTTFVHREVYSINSPGTGWVFQGQGLWAKAVDYTNEVETEIVNEYYRLTRDIDDEKHRVATEYIERAMFETNMTTEYDAGDVMWDNSCEWYENDMGDLAADPFGQMRLHEEAFIGKSWYDGMTELCREFNLRIYYSKGRYHVEQISLRDAATFTRFKYQFDGDLLGTESVNLDLDFTVLGIKPGSGGRYKILAPLKSVEAKVKLESKNLLEGVSWVNSEYGTRYIGRTTRTAGTQKMWVKMYSVITSTFNPLRLILYPQDFINLICRHVVRVDVVVRIHNVNTNTTYYLNVDDSSWDTDPVIRSVRISGNFGHPGNRFTVENYGHTEDNADHRLSDDMPGSEGDLFDIHVSYNAYIVYWNPEGTTWWTVVHPDDHWILANSENNIMQFYSEATTADYSGWVETDANLELVFVAENDVNNSIKVTTEIQWADTGQAEKSIEIYTGTEWKRSSGWSIGGTGTPKAIGELLVYEIMSLRTLPKRLYSGSYLSSIPNAESRLQRDTKYYLPLTCSKDTDVDEFSGEFLEIAKTTPPDVEVIENPIAGGPQPGPGFPEGDTPGEDIDPIAVTFETNEVITGGVAITEVDIINTAEVFIQSGTRCKIMNPTTGVFEYVTLTQDVDPADTVMYFTSYNFVATYPDASYIIPVIDAGNFPTSLDQVYYFYKDKFTATSISAPNFNFLDPEEFGLHDINKRYKLKRNGVQIFCKFNVTEPETMIKTYYYDNVGKTWEFYGDGLQDEEIEIEAF